MSHFNILVHVPNGKTLEDMLDPFHEFECTGEDNQYVQDIDETDSHLKDYETKTTPFCVNGERRLRPWDNLFFRELNEEENEKSFMGIGTSGAISWTSQDWGDGKGYRPKIKFTPEGWERKEIPFKEIYPTFKEYVLNEVFGEEDDKIIPFGEVRDPNNKNTKYGYVSLNEDGSIAKIVRRTNPNSKWDWYVVGGRWDKVFPVTSETKKEFQFEEFRLSRFEEYKKNDPDTTRDEWKAMTWAFLSEDGKWNEIGEMGWWGLSAHENKNDYDGENGAWWTWYRSLPDDAQLVLVDCHI